MAGFLEGLSNFFLGSNPQSAQLGRFTPQQQGLQDQGIQNLLQLLQSGGGMPGNFAPIAQKAKTQFQTETIPSLAERFTALGGQNSSAFQGALGQAGAGLNENLGALESQYGLQQNAQVQNLMRLLLGLSTQPSFENVVYQGQPGALQGLAEGIGSYAGAGVPGAASWVAKKLGFGG
jgi:hypothetical protein